MTIDPIDAALRAFWQPGDIDERIAMQAAIDAYEAARGAGELVWGFDAARGGDFSVYTSHPPVASPQTRETACGENAPETNASPIDAHVDGAMAYRDGRPRMAPTHFTTVAAEAWKWGWEQERQRAAVLAHVPVKNEFVANLRAQYAERGLTGDEGGSRR